MEQTQCRQRSLIEFIRTVKNGIVEIDKLPEDILAKYTYGLTSASWTKKTVDRSSACDSFAQ